MALGMVEAIGPQRGMKQHVLDLRGDRGYRECRACRAQGLGEIAAGFHAVAFGERLEADLGEVGVQALEQADRRSVQAFDCDPATQRARKLGEPGSSASRDASADACRASCAGNLSTILSGAT